MPIPSRSPFTVGTMQFQILDRALVQVTAPTVPYSVISITGSDQQHPLIPDAPHRIGLLRLKFDDIQMPIPGMTLFTEEHAREIIAFYAQIKKSTKLMVVNCEQGICRSSAVAAGLTDSERGSAWFERRFSPNAHVRRVLVAVIRQQGQHNISNGDQDEQGKVI